MDLFCAQAGLQQALDGISTAGVDPRLVGHPVVVEVIERLSDGEEVDARVALRRLKGLEPLGQAFFEGLDL